jgi:chorismate mutase
MHGIGGTECMGGKSKYYLVRDKALPEVLQKVIEVKRLLTSEKSLTVQDAAQRAGLSRSSFYKYKDDIVPFSDNTMGKTMTLVTQMSDEPGLLSDLLHVVAAYRANILTIHQAIPVNGVATVTLSVEVLADTGDVDGLVEEIENLTGIYDLRILGIEKG